MGLFSSRKTSTTNQNFDQSINLADSELDILEAGAIQAEDIGSIKRDSENLNIAGANNTVTQFGDNAARVVGDAIAAMELTTSKNLQLQTQKDLLSENLRSEAAFTFDDVQDVFKNPKIQVAAALAGAGILYIFYRKVK